MKNSHSGNSPKPGYAFFLAWPFSNAGGVNGVVRNLLHQFHANGTFAPVAIEISEGTRENLPSDTLRPWPLIRTGQISTWNPKRPWRSIIAFLIKAPAWLWRMRSICREHSIEVLNPHFIGMEYFLLMLLRHSGMFPGKLILSFHGADIREMIQSRGLERSLLRTLVLAADVLVSCSDGLREEILLFVPERADRTLVIHNGIDADAFLSLPAQPVQIPDRFSGRRILLSVGAFEYKKGHDILLRAYLKVRNAYPDTMLIIAGQRSAADLTRLAGEIGIQDDVLLLENLPHGQIAWLLSKADLFVFSSRWEKGRFGEGFAMALLEAGAASKPVVTSRTCGATELIVDRETGRIVPTEDPDALAEAIQDVLADPEEARRLAARLHQHVIENFTWRRAYERYLQIAGAPHDA